MPTQITVMNTAGTAQIDLGDPSNYNITSGTFAPLDSAAQFKTARFNLRRDLGLKIAFTVKTGVVWQEEKRDIKGDTPATYTFVGPDGVANTADDNAGLYDIADPQYSQGPYLLN